MSGTCPTTPFPSRIKLQSTPRILTNLSMSGKKFSRAFGVHLWNIEATYPPMTRANFDTIYAFALAQNGSYGTFTFAAHDRRTPRGAASGSPSGTPLIKGANQSGTSINTDGWTHSITGLLLPGDLVLLPGSTKVYMNTSTVSSDGSGNATLTLNTDVVAAPTDNGAITIVNVPFTVSLSQDIQELYTDQPDVYQYVISMTEAL